MGVRLAVRSADGRVLDEELSYAFEQTRIVIGRGVGADVRIPHLTVSERHALLVPQADGYGIEDADSTNGTLVNGTRLVAGRRRRLQDGDVIRVGVYELGFKAGVVVTEPITAERTAELARRLFRSGRPSALLSQPRLVVVAGPGTGRSLELPRAPCRVRVGRGEDNQLALDDPAVLPAHLELLRDFDGVLARALPNAGVQLGSHAVEERRLRDGDELVVGQTRLLFEDPADESLLGMAAREDERMPEPEPNLPEPAPEATAAIAATDAAPGPAPSPSRAAKPRNFDADLIIYALAAVVMVVSIAGLLVLMR